MFVDVLLFSGLLWKSATYFIAQFSAFLITLSTAFTTLAIFREYIVAIYAWRTNIVKTCQPSKYVFINNTI